ncbi:nucleotidyl transferase AbiEii/AbiGii toxin family protein [Pedobacter sp. ISL-68]|uniref:nucleotidyl transferase AbiEii/AbiGii toxin family protein n=1 Tax=unclassified Pedobacter TaxID=2628915 RepID=UPI001BEB4D88|nr:MULTISPECIES: nucleotidyl transferase AbiEii/AbiGii toxin family protein [unclassified Pedobacter]MBT2563763.1 nucleotidyl transferase AbiEii/AbiGii toxin family protein [Pedobacter sp. ISL-64]MBT2589655.1 nucleotidyl transferase AbiEii/AbiGii toxin family protein [Pedobacter sp. ISL-68]
MAQTLDQIKRLTITALLNDEVLMALLVLKGGNAIDLLYDLSNRGSIDIDFSMEKDFTEKEIGYVRNQIDYILNSEFNKHGLQVIDVRFIDKPKNIREEVKDFWGGYKIYFKVISSERFSALEGDVVKCVREAIPISGNNSTVFEVDISKYEYVADKRAKDFEGTIVYVYSPEMLALEKYRALCQQNPSYRDIVYSMTSKSRARDFYDIHNLVSSFNLKFDSDEDLGILTSIFDAKKVPLDYLLSLNDQYELHRQSWDSVLDTIDVREKPKEFDYYFQFVLDIAGNLHSKATGKK